MFLQANRAGPGSLQRMVAARPCHFLVQPWSELGR